MQQQQFSSSDSLGALISICSPKEEQRNNQKGYSREFQAMLDSLEHEDCAEESGLASEKKRRLRSDQVRALEKYFEVENKLEPERKVKLAEELGLQPRQVAIWFQNRRARWKTKQLERDYGVLRANYDALKLNFNNLQQEKEALSAELKELKVKLRRQNAEKSPSPENNISSEQSKFHDFCDNGDKVYGEFKDINGSSESDSDGIFKDESDVHNINGHAHQQLIISPSPPQHDAAAASGFHNLAGSSSSSSSSHSKQLMNWFQLPDLRVIPGSRAATHQQQLVKMEEQGQGQGGLFSTEESCSNIFSVDQAPTLHWYFTEH